MSEHRSMLAVVAEAAGLGTADQPARAMPNQAALPSQAPERHSVVVDTGQRFSLVSSRSKPVSGAEQVEKLKARGVTVTTAEATTLEDLAAKWNASADIRSEFRTFEAFAGYMVAKAAGRAKIYGQD